ncbi:hypothetical protein BGZ99_010283 [Dissophora globulifera]|uniref:RING-type domain-containing protein n=1 Tax=Dissophora globulifera TaxID=979702 RepID=A0A9P6UL58_9FUNG|nr:hypothetical protein BGZ99_010283 [Dissophora globulifera]
MNELQQRPQQEQHDDDYADMATAAPGRPRSVLDMAIDTASNNPAGRELAATVAVLIIDRNSSCSYLKILLILFAVRVAIALPIAIYSHMHPRVQGAPLTTRYILLERVRTLLEITGTCLFFLANYFLFTQSQCRVAAPAVYYMTVVYVILGYIVILIPIILCLAVILCLPLVLRIMRTLGLGPVGVVKGATEEMIASIHVVKYRRPVIVEAEAGSGVTSTVVDMGENSSGSTELCVTPAAGAISAVVTSAPGTVATDTAAPLLTTPGRPKRGFLGLFKNSKKSAISTRPISESIPTYPEPAEFEYLTLMDPQDAVCAICLCDYEDEEELRKLNCSHHFHKACVDEWLRLNRNCPLCKRDIEELAGGRPAEVAGAAAL